MSKSDRQDYNKCQMLLANLYLHVKSERSNEPTDSKFTIVELMDTAKCDRHAKNDLSLIREATKEKINRTDKTRLDKILNDDDTVTKKDEAIVQRVAHEYRTWYTTELKKALSWKTWAACEVFTPTFYDGVGAGLAAALISAIFKYSSSQIYALSVGTGVAYPRIFKKRDPRSPKN